MSKLYSLYDQLTTPQGLTENDAKYFLDEGVSLIQKLLPSIKTPKTVTENVENKYSDVDALVYTNKLDLMERLKSNITCIELPCKHNLCKRHLHTSCKSNKFKTTDPCLVLVRKTGAVLNR